MAWKTLGDALETAIAMGMESGEMGAATPSQPKSAKSAGAKAPASVTGQRQATTKVVDYANAEKPRALPTGREMVTAASSLPPRRAIPMHAVAISLVVDNSGRRAPTGGGAARLVGRRNSGEGTACEWLKLVHAST